MKGGATVFTGQRIFQEVYPFGDGYTVTGGSHRFGRNQM